MTKVDFHALLAILAISLTGLVKAEASSFSTNFSGLAAGSDPANLGAVDFLSPGEVQFFANGPYYVSGSNRAWGFADQGQVNIAFGDFTGGVSSLLADAGSHASEVSLALRGSRSTDRNNRAGVNFDDANVGFVWYDENNVRWLGGVTVNGSPSITESINNGSGLQDYISISNDSYQTVEIDPTAVGASAVSRIRLVQGNLGDQAFALVGSISYSTVPEPTAALLAAFGLTGWAGCRRRRN